MIIEGRNIYCDKGESGALEIEFKDDDGNVAQIESTQIRIYTIVSQTVVYTAESNTVDVTGLATGVYWYQVDAETDLGHGRINGRLYVLGGKE